jgi:hypothetical protein
MLDWVRVELRFTEPTGVAMAVVGRCMPRISFLMSSNMKLNESWRRKIMALAMMMRWNVCTEDGGLAW